MRISEGTFWLVTGVAVALVVVSWVGWGFWAGYSFAVPVIITAIAAAILLWARTGLGAWTSVQRQDEPFTGYPEDQVLGVFDSTREAGEAIEDFRRAGFGREELAVYSDRQGAARLDSEGTAHGLREVAQRQIEHIVTDIDDLQGYEAAVRRGGVVVGVVAPDEEPREQVAAVFQRHGAHDVHYFGAMTVQRLDVDSSRTHTN
ncbi:MAG: hypothetical protein GEU80_05155 [Dehalococcoidia bacterium]|nr:hypothetical protein [Dehalococcoidia bacterium]